MGGSGKREEREERMGGGREDEGGRMREDRELGG